MVGSVGKFLKDRSGAFAIQFALMVVPLTVCTGLAIDGGRAFLARYELSAAVDAAALAIGSTLDENADLNLLAHTFVNANFHGEHEGPITLELTDVGDEDETVILKGNVTINTYFMPLVGQPTVTVSAESEVKRGGNDVEVALVLDITGSMSGSRIVDLRTAASDLVDTVVGDIQTPYYSKVALVPYSNAVNVGTYAAAVRGAATGPVSISDAAWKHGSSSNISGATWRNGTAMGISGVTKASQAVVTSNSHGFANGDYVYIYSVSGMTQLNNKRYLVSDVTTNTFKIKNADTGAYINSSSYSTYSSSSSDRAQECFTQTCEVQVTTASAHGYAAGEFVYVTGVSGMTQINNSVGDTWTIASAPTSTTMILAGSNGPSYSNYSTSGSDKLQRCFTDVCEVQVTTSATHGLADNDYVRITGVSGMSDINTSGNNSWQVTGASTTTYILSGSEGPDYSNYSSGGASQCLKAGCEYFRFNNANNGAARIHQISTCVSERTGAQAYTDAAPSSAPVGRSYPPSSGNTCTTSAIEPLSSDKADLKAKIGALPAAGSTAGQIGIGWGWYMLSPNFASLFPSASQPAAYDEPNLAKVAVLMTDGEFNTPYCQGVIAEDATSGSGSDSDHIDCNATNGNPYTQAANLCTGMKNAGVIVYTVGFDISSSTAVTNLLNGCATSAQHAYLASDGAELKKAFKNIASSIAQLRIAR
jgi:Flp pilus assembly protein TadG